MTRTANPHAIAHAIETTKGFYSGGGVFNSSLWETVARLRESKGNVDHVFKYNVATGELVQVAV